jgi:hypothetical protein
MRLTIWLLYLVEFADWDSQAKIGYGGGNGTAHENMGASDEMPYHTGTMQTSRTTYGVGCQYRYIEGLWETVFDWLDGGYNDKNGMNIILNPSKFSDTEGGVSAGVPYEASFIFGYPTAFAVSDSGGFQLFYPTNELTTNGTETTSDYWYFSKNSPTWICGDHYGWKDSYTGMFSFSSMKADDINDQIGCRVMKLPKA